MEVAVVPTLKKHQAVCFEEHYDEYLSTFQLNSDVPNRSPEAMLAYVCQADAKEKWNKIKNFLMRHWYKSWDAYLSLERVYRSVVNGTGINCGKKYTTKKGILIMKRMSSHAVMGVASRFLLDVTVMDYGKCWKLGT